MSTPQHNNAHLYATYPSITPPPPPPSDYILWQLAFCPRPPWPEPLCSFDFPSLALIAGSHLLFLLPRASCFRLAPAGLARPSEGAREAGWGCLSNSAQVGEMSQLVRVTVSPWRPGWSHRRYFWKAWLGFPSHTIYLLSEIIINNEYLRHGDHPWWPALILESYLWERIGRRPLTIHRTRSVNTQHVLISQTSC